MFAFLRAFALSAEMRVYNGFPQKGTKGAEVFLAFTAGDEKVI